jgi:beta-fructofuranosidase
VADALVPGDSPAWDDLATWTGSIVREDDGRWRLFYTGVDRAGGGLVQRIGTAVSDDLYVWRREGEPDDPRAGLLLEADPRWYEQLAERAWMDEAWRDPWVLRDPDGDGWHMLITARARQGAPDDRGVVGHARSADLRTWTVEPPLTEPGNGFGQMEVTQVEEVEGGWVLVFCCLGSELGRARQEGGEHGGVWVAEAAGPLGPFDVAGAYRLTDESFYAGRLVRDRQGAWVLLAFHHTGPDGEFVGGLSDPMPVRRDPAAGGRLTVVTDVPATGDPVADQWHEAAVTP